VPGRAIAGDADDVCFVDGDAIRCSKKSGGTMTTLARGVASSMTPLVVDRGFVYFSAALESMADEVYRFPVTAVAPEPDADRMPVVAAVGSNVLKLPR
jgi:hypothetical protein